MKQDILKRIADIMDSKVLDENEINLKLIELVRENRIWNSTIKTDGSFSELFSEYNETLIKPRFENIVKSGFKDFDKKFGGFSLGEFVVLGGRPSMGKTQLLQSLCKNVSEVLPTLYLTFDHSVSVITARFVSCLSNIPINKILHNELEQNDKLLLEYHGKCSSKYKLFITDHGNSIVDFKDRCLKQIKENNIKVIIVDYLQKMKAKKNGNRSDINTITNELKHFSKDNNVAIIAASQLNRSVESRGGDKRPLLCDLKGSESIEEDADKIIFIYRPEYYGITVDENGSDTRGLVELIMAKNKNGKLGTIRLLRDIAFTDIKSV